MRSPTATLRFCAGSRVGGPNQPGRGSALLRLYPARPGLVRYFPCDSHARSRQLNLAGFGNSALLYTPGWLLGVTRRTFPVSISFRIPGRYGVITTLGVAVLAGKSLDRLRNSGASWLCFALLIGFVGAMWTALRLDLGRPRISRCQLQLFQPVRAGPLHGLFGIRCRRHARRTDRALAGDSRSLTSVERPNDQSRPQSDALVFTVCALVVTVPRLWLVSRVVTYSVMVAVFRRSITLLGKSGAKILAERGGRCGSTVLSHLGTVLDAAATPVYLTFGPALMMIPNSDATYATDASPAVKTETLQKQVDWRPRAGVTHALSVLGPGEMKLPGCLVGAVSIPYSIQQYVRTSNRKDDRHCLLVDGNGHRLPAWDEFVEMIRKDGPANAIIPFVGSIRLRSSTQLRAFDPNGSK